MMYLISVDSVSKELRLRGKVSARAVVPSGSYDVNVGTELFRGVSVAEPHVNSSTPHRVLSVVCHLDSFGLEEHISGLLSKRRPCKLTFHRISDCQSADERRAERGCVTSGFELIVSSMYTYATITGHLHPARAEEVDLVLATKEGFIAIEAKAQVDVPAKATKKTIPVRVRVKDEQVEAYFADKNKIADDIGRLLKEGKVRQIPLQVEGFRDSVQKSSLKGHFPQISERLAVKPRGQSLEMEFHGALRTLNDLQRS